MGSDDEYEYEYASDGGGYEYSDNEAGEEGGENSFYEVENAFYEGDELVSEKRLSDALEEFEKVVTVETAREAKGVKIETWRFKALQNLVKIHFALKSFEPMIAAYRLMLGDMALVSRNEVNDAISSILDMLSAETEEASQVRAWGVVLKRGVLRGNVYYQHCVCARVCVCID